MKNVVKYLIISFVFSGFMMFGNINEVYASEGGIIETETVCSDNLYINDYTSLTYFNNAYYINYTNITIYNNEINTAVENWNVFDLVTIGESETNISLTIEEQDLGSNGSIAMYTIDECSKKIILNSYYFNDLTFDEKVMVISHELGHALGLVDLDPDLGYQSIMNSLFEPNNQVTLIDALMLLNILNLEENNFGTEYYFDVMNLCFADANDDGLSCIGGGGGGTGSSSITNSYSEIINTINNYVLQIDEIINYVMNDEVSLALYEINDIIPSFLLHPHNGAWAMGIYASMGSFPIGSGLLPVGGTIGIQFVYDSYNILAIQLFIGAGVHLLPHAEVVGYTMYYNGIVSYKDLEGWSAQLSASIVNWGISGEYIWSEDIYGFGFSSVIVKASLPINFNIVLEVQNTQTIYTFNAL